MSGKTLLDTNVFIDYLRTGAHEDWVAGRVEGTVRFLSAIVMMELRMGADTPLRRRAVDRIRRAFPDPRFIAPGPELYDRAAVLFRRIHGDAAGMSDRLGAVNDILIALSAWQIGARIVTSNLKDFRRIAKLVSGVVVVDPTAR